MYTRKDALDMLNKRGELQTELGIIRARYHKREEEMPQDVKKYIEQLERDILEIDSLFSLFSDNEKFVVHYHIMEGLDWQQVLLKYVEKWGTPCEKNTRSFQLWQAKALNKVACAMNKNISVAND